MAIQIPVKQLSGVLDLAGTRAMTGALNMNTHQITGVVDPTNNQDVATKKYVLDTVGLASAGLSPKNSCTVATAAALPAYTRVANVITADANGAIPQIDGVTVAVTTPPTRILLKDGASGADNGIYDLTDAGSGGTPWVLTRSTDADTSAEVVFGIFALIMEGTANGKFGFALMTHNPITLNTTSLTFSEIFITPGASFGTDVTAVGSSTSNGSGSTVAHSNHVHATPRPITQANLTAEVTVSDGDEACATGFSADNALGGDIAILVNGIRMSCVSGAKTGAFFISGDSGSTARAFSAVVTGDKAYFNGTVAGWQLETTDKVSFVYTAF
jgi:hypothetical protein